MFVNIDGTPNIDVNSFTTWKLWKRKSTLVLDMNMWSFGQSWNITEQS